MNTPELSPYYDPEPEPDFEEICPECQGEGRGCMNPDCYQGVVGRWLGDFESVWDEPEGGD